MPADYEGPDHVVKHLEMVQAVITRLGNDSFLVKGWAVTVAGLFLGFAVSSKEEALAFVAVVPICFFWGLDAYYLRSERLFRAFYERVRTQGEGVVPFGMNATSPEFVKTLTKQARAPVWRTMWRPALWMLYLGLMFSATAVCGVVAAVGGDSSDDRGSRHARCAHTGGKVGRHC